MTLIHKIGAIIIRDRKLLVVKKQGMYIAPGGKLEAGEDHQACLTRGLDEEVRMQLRHATFYATFTHKSALEAGVTVKMDVYWAHADGEPIPSNEITEALFVAYEESRTLKIGSIMKEEIIPRLYADKLID